MLYFNAGSLDVLGSECDDYSRPHTEVTGASDESKEHHVSGDGGGVVDTDHNVSVDGVSADDGGVVVTNHNVNVIRGSDDNGDDDRGDDNRFGTVDRGGQTDETKCCCTIM